MNLNLLRNKHLEKNHKIQPSTMITYNNYKSNLPSHKLNNNLNLSIQRANKGSSRNYTPNTNKSAIGKNDTEAISSRKASTAICKNTSVNHNNNNNKNLKDKFSIKTDYNSYMNGKYLSERKASNTKSINSNLMDISAKKTNSGNNMAYNSNKIKSSSVTNLNLIPDDMNLFVSNNFSKSNRNSDAEKIDFLSEKDKNNNNNINSKYNEFTSNLDKNSSKRKNNINSMISSSVHDNSKDDLINHYSKDLDKIFNTENDKKEQNDNKRSEVALTINNKITNHLNNKKDNQSENKLFMTENNYDYDKSQINLNTSQNKNYNKNTAFKNFNTSINTGNNINTSRNMVTKYNFTSFNQTQSKNSNFISNASNKMGNRYENNGPTIVKAATNNYSNFI